MFHIPTAIESARSQGAAFMTAQVSGQSVLIVPLTAESADRLALELGPCGDDVAPCSENELEADSAVDFIRAALSEGFSVFDPTRGMAKRS